MERFQFAQEEAQGIPLILSGDILDLEMAKPVLESGLGQGLIVARGLIKQPWLIKEIRDYLNGVETPYSLEDRAQQFYLSMLQLAIEDPKYWNPNYFTEMAMYLFGVKSETFRIFKTGKTRQPTDLLEDWSEINQSILSC